MNRPTILERAFELANSGEHQAVESIAQVLSQENYVDARAHLQGRSLRAELQALCRAATTRKGARTKA